jgi:hypothetical protein
MGVYKLHKLARSGNRFTKEVIVSLERDNHVIQNAYADEVNSNSEINGLLYEKDEKATALYLSGKPFKTVKEYVSFEEVKTDDEKERLLQEYLELQGEPAKGTWGVKKLTEEIEKLKTI